MDDQLNKISLDIWTYLNTNKDWLFSGIGASLVLILVGYAITRLERLISRKYKKNREKENLEEEEEEEEKFKQHIRFLKADHIDRLKYDPEYRELHKKILTQKSKKMRLYEETRALEYRPLDTFGGHFTYWGIALFVLTLITAGITWIC